MNELVKGSGFRNMFSCGLQGLDDMRDGMREEVAASVPARLESSRRV